MLRNYADADDAYPGASSSAGACSDGVDPALSVFVEVTLRKSLSGEQLGEKKVFDVSRSVYDEHDHGPSLGALIAMGKEHEREGANYTYHFFLTDDRRVECTERIYDKLVWYVDMLESIPVEEGSRRHADSRYHRLELRQHATGGRTPDV